MAPPFFTSGLDALAALPLGKSPPPSTHWIGGWLGPRTGLDDVRRRILSLPGLQPLGHPARSQVIDIEWFARRITLWNCRIVKSVVLTGHATFVPIIYFCCCHYCLILLVDVLLLIYIYIFNYGMYVFVYFLIFFLSFVKFDGETFLWWIPFRADFSPALWVWS
jgi:hypothetical protein